MDPAGRKGGHFQHCQRVEIFVTAPAGQKVPLGVLLAASWLPNLLYFLFAFAGIESADNITNPGVVPTPFSHGLFMAVVWSVLAGVLAWRVYRSQRAGVVIGLVVFSHWVLDYISWNNLHLFFDGSPFMFMLLPLGGRGR
jgi:hypothetical protein